jgi:hypothetical protein
VVATALRLEAATLILRRVRRSSRNRFQVSCWVVGDWDGEDDGGTAVDALRLDMKPRKGDGAAVLVAKRGCGTHVTLDDEREAVDVENEDVATVDEAIASAGMRRPENAPVERTALTTSMIADLLRPAPSSELTRAWGGSRKDVCVLWKVVSAIGASGLANNALRDERAVSERLWNQLRSESRKCTQTVEGGFQTYENRSLEIVRLGGCVGRHSRPGPLFG